MSRYSYHETQRTTTIPRWYEKNPNIDTSTITKTFLGIVRDSRDPQGMGRLLVWIPELTGDPDVPKNWFICAYASPFAGASFFDVGLFKDDVDGSDAIETINSRAGPDGANRTPTKVKGQLSGRQSYGMWFVPPDIGNEVLVTFINGDPGFGVWFGCLFPQDMTHMIPGVASNNITSSQGTTSEVGPVLETDLSVERIENRGDSPQRRMFKPLRDGLKLYQGLNNDSIRGQSSSSAQREARRSQTPLPSEVFGVLTPNGSHFVLDDDPDNELIRVRTKSGAQLLINETNGLIYAITKDGKTWIELSNEGDIDVYAGLNISFHAEKGNINFRAGQDVNIQAVRDFNIRSDRDFKIASLSDIDIKGNGDIKIQVNGEIHQKSGSIFRQTAGADFDIVVDGDYREEATFIYMNSGGANSAADAKFPNTSTPAGPSIPPQNSNDDWSVGNPYEKGTNIVPRVPQHEPYSEHDFISTDDVFVPGPTASFNNDSRVKSTNTPTDTNTTPATTSTGNPVEPDANTTPVVRPGTTPPPENGVCNLTADETQSLMDAIGFRESGSQTNIENTLGFVGKYQFGTAALEDVGLIKPGTYSNAQKQGIDPQSVLNNSNNWTIDGGKEAFLDNQQIQEEAMLRLMSRNCNILMNSGVITSNTTKQETAGLLTASHIGGAGGAQALLDGNNRSDAYGGSTSEYFQLGASVLRDIEREAAEAASA